VRSESLLLEQATRVAPVTPGLLQCSASLPPILILSTPALPLMLMLMALPAPSPCVLEYAECQLWAPSSPASTDDSSDGQQDAKEDVPTQDS
jgi:hypothetical protein